MTVIVYRDGVLAADGSAIEGRAPSVVTPWAKIRVIRSGYMAFALSGAALSEQVLLQLEGMFLDAVYLALADPTGDTTLVRNAALMADRNAIVLTREHAFVVRQGKAYEQVHELGGPVGTGPTLAFESIPPGEFDVIGSGIWLAHVALLKGLSAKEAVRFGAKYDYLSFPVGQIQSIEASRLKPLPREINHV